MSRSLRFDSRSNLLGTLFIGALLTVACSTQSGAETDTDPNQPDDARAFAIASCARLERCSLDVLKQEYGDVEKCNDIEGAASDQDLNAPGAATDRAKIASCTQKLGAAACGTLTTECDFRGSAAVGAACGTDEQCASGYCKHGADASGNEPNACGKCYATVGSGGDCTSAVCSAPHETCVNNRCTVLPGRGAACDPENLPCLSPLACVAKQCVDRLAAGTACTTTSGSVPCASGLSCIAGTCTAPTITYAHAGEACNVASSSPTRTKCLAGECVKGTCVALADRGQPCSEDIGCIGSLICRGGTCVFDDPSACK
jgi:hypothetical protein